MEAVGEINEDAPWRLHVEKKRGTLWRTNGEKERKRFNGGR